MEQSRSETRKNGVVERLSVALLLVALAATGVSAVRAQSADGEALSLEAAIARALETHPDLKAALGNEELSKSAVSEAGSHRLPVLRFTQSGIRSNNPVFVFGSLLEQGRFAASNFSLPSLNNPSSLNNLRSVLGGQVSLFDQRQTSSRTARAKLGRTQAQFRSEGVRQKLRLDVIKAYYAVVLARDRLEVAGEALKSAEANRERVANLVEVGSTTEADLLAAEVEVAMSDQQRVEAESRLAIAKAEFNLMIGTPQSSDHRLTGELRELHLPTAPLEEMVRTAFSERPDFRSAVLEAERAAKGLEGAKGQNLPRIDAFANYGVSSHDMRSGSGDYTVGVTVGYTVFDAGRKARVEQAAAGKTVAEAEKESLERQVRLDVMKANENFKTSQSRIRVLTKSVAQAEEALRIVKARHQVGMTTFSEVLRAESSLFGAKQGLLAARYDYYVAYASLQLAFGKLTDGRLFN